MSLASEVISEEPVKLGFWHRLSAAVVSASIAFWLLYAVFILVVSLAQSMVGLYRSQPLSMIDSFAGSEEVIILGVLLIGYPIERFWVRASDGCTKAAGKYLVLFSVLLVIGVMLSGLWPDNFAHLVISIILTTTGITACVGRLLYTLLVKFKFAMYVSAGVIGAFVLMSILHLLLQASGVLPAV